MLQNIHINVTVNEINNVAFIRPYCVMCHLDQLNNFQENLGNKEEFRKNSDIIIFKYFFLLKN